MKQRAGSMLEARNRQRESASPRGGSLGATMHQGGSYSHPSANTLPQLLNQGGSTKRGDKSKAVMLRNLMSQ